MGQWLTEKHTDGYSVNWKIAEVLHKEQTAFQELMIVETDEFGRALVLDGNLQTTVKDEFIYHEMLAHIPMFTHPNPQKVLVIGGGDGGTIREVLKHSSVQQADLVEIDGRVIDLCKRYLPEISYALEDERCNVIVDDGIKFIKENKDTYDVILIDSSDPIGPATQLFAKEFYQGVFNALKADGLFAAQTESPIFCEELFGEVFRGIKGIFPIARTYLTAIPTYFSGLWSFTMGSKKYDPLKTVVREHNFANKYYNSEIHQAAFVLPQFIKRLTE